MTITKEELQEIATSELEKAVVEWAAGYGDDEGDIECALSDLQQNGCVSGMVGCLIYYRDTCAFYEKHKEEIWDLLEECREMSGEKTIPAFIATLNGAEQVGSHDQLENLLAWFAFEETAARLSGRLGI